MHQSAKLLLELIRISDDLDPTFWPSNIDALISLPGIARSTAGSILSAAFDKSFPILDGSVKRLLARLTVS